jgi:hypothetical protein
VFGRFVGSVRKGGLIFHIRGSRDGFCDAQRTLRPIAESLESRCLLSLTSINHEDFVPSTPVNIGENSGATADVRQLVDHTNASPDDTVVTQSTVLNSGGGITGTVVVDPLGGGVTDPDDPAKAPAGQQVYLDLQHSGQFAAGDPTTTTDANGDFSFTGLANGTYTVRFVPYKATPRIIRPTAAARQSLLMVRPSRM